MRGFTLQNVREKAGDLGYRLLPPKWGDTLRRNAFLQASVCFLLLICGQFAILLLGSLKGLGNLPFSGGEVFGITLPLLFPLLILSWDFFGLHLRLKSKGHMPKTVVYVPPTLLCFGVCVQALSAVVGNADPHVTMIRTVGHMGMGFICFFLVFWFSGYAARFAEKFRPGKVLLLIASIVVLFLTVFLNETGDNDAFLSWGGVQVFQLVSLAFVFFLSAVFQSGQTPAPRAVYIILFWVAAFVGLVVFMRETGTFVVFTLTLLIAIATDIDKKDLPVFVTMGLGKVIGFLLWIPNWLANRLTEFFARDKDEETKNKIRKNILIAFVIIFFIFLTVVIVLNLHEIKAFWDKFCAWVKRKYNERVYPWLGLSVDDHQEKLSKAFKSGGIFGVDSVIYAVIPPHFEADCTMAVVFELFGFLGGLFTLVLYFLLCRKMLLICAQSRHLFRDFSDVSLLPECRLVRLVRKCRLVRLVRGFLKMMTGWLSNHVRFHLFDFDVKQFMKWLMKDGPVFTGRYAATASILLMVQILVPVASAVKAFPIAGLPTPLLSGGGMQYMVVFALLGMITGEVYAVTADKAYEENAAQFATERAEVKEARQRRRQSASRLRWIVRTVAATLVLALVVTILCMTIWFSNYIDEKCEIMNTVDYTYTAQEVHAPAKEVADIPVADNPNVYNFIIIGLDNDNGNARSDSMILFSIDRKAKTVKMCSLQRDTWLLMPSGQKHKLNAAYRYGNFDMLCETIRMNYRIPVHGVGRINRASFKRIIDACGGISMVLSEDEANYLNNKVEKAELTGYQDVVADKTPQHLDGWLALEYVRMRKSNHTSDNDYKRTDRQQKIIKAIGKKVKGLATSRDFKSLIRFVDVVAEELDTNVDGDTANDLLVDVGISVLPQLIGNDDFELERYQIPGQYYSDNYRSKSGEYQLRPQLRRTTLYLREVLYGKESVKNIKR